ncbi:MAG: thiopurine S-methyltransferase [Alphaproteobacteria bacterium]|nr:thiopurine S-methyltransferase [Alphaproteobacteria bacterium]
MDESFWRRKWERNEIAFHEGKANSWLVKYFGDLSLPEGSRVFLPLCGKTRDIHWLLSRGHRVAGAELSRIAIEQLFSELLVEPTITAIDEINQYSFDNIDIFVGDIFRLSLDMLGPVDAIYDRAALVALPDSMRAPYATHLMEITDRAPQLLVTYEYDQRLVDGPPFSVSHEEVSRHYRPSYDLKLLASAEIKGGLKGRYPAAEHAWLLERNHA